MHPSRYRMAMIAMLLSLGGCGQETLPPRPTMSDAALPFLDAAVEESDISLEEAGAYFMRVAHHAMKNHVHPTRYQHLLEGALEGMLSNLDPHSGFLTATEFQELQQATTGTYAGVGVELAAHEGALCVVAPLDETPASRAGVQPRDIILSIDQQDVAGMSLDNALELLKGPAGSQVEITIDREGHPPFSVLLRREIMQEAAVQSQVLHNILYLRIRSFNTLTTPGARAALEKARTVHGDALQGVLVDLRHNPGGLLDAAESLADLFLEGGTIVSVHTRFGTQHRQARPSGTPQMPLTHGLCAAVLVDAGTASSAEIFAAALQDHHRAVVLGTPTFGKGSVQSVVPLEDGAAIKLTTALYHTPHGTAIQQKGIVPDIEIQQLKHMACLDDASIGRESDLIGALAPPEPTETAIPESLHEGLDDYQLRGAIDVLQGMILARGLEKDRGI